VTRLHYHCPVNIQKAEKELGFKPTPFPLALKQALDWLATEEHRWPVSSSLPPKKRSIEEISTPSAIEKGN
jgi:hypothetical protein